MNSPQSRPGLPANAKLVFKGVLFEVWQWEQKMFDSTTATFERIWRSPTVEVIAAVGDKIMIEEQSQPDKPNVISLPGGRADQDDDTLNEAKRELLEETGYESDDWSLFFKHGGDGKVIHEMHYFIARNCRRTQEPHLDAGEKITARLVTFAEFLKLADEPRFWIAPEFANYLCKLRADEIKKAEFQKLIFPKK